MDRQFGRLYLVGTPIGNLEDITLRALRILGEVELVVAEDTRRASSLMSALELKRKEIISFNMHNQSRRIPMLLGRLKNGEKIALVSDAGMPVISDPGATLVRICRENGIEVDVIPGPSAVTTAVALSGFPGANFTFLGFLPRGKNRRRLFRRISTGTFEESLIVFFESPYRLLETLRDLLETLGDRDIFVAREMTKKFQESLNGKISEIIAHFASSEPVGELTVVVSGRSGENARDA